MAITKQTARKSTKAKDLSTSAVADTADQREIKPIPASNIKQRYLPGWPQVTLPADAFTPDPVKEARAIKIFFVQQLDALKDNFLREMEQRDERQDKQGIDLEKLKPVIEDLFAETAEEMVSDVTEPLEGVIEREGEATTDAIVDAIQQLEGHLVDKINVALADNTKVMQEWFAGFVEGEGGVLPTQKGVTDPSEQLEAPGQQPTAAEEAIERFTQVAPLPEPDAATARSMEQLTRLFPLPEPTAATTSSIDEFERLWPLPDRTSQPAGQSINSIDQFTMLFPLPDRKSDGTEQQSSSSKDTTRLDAVGGATATAGQGEGWQLGPGPISTRETQRQSIEIANLVQANEELAQANKKLVDANNDLAGANAALALANDKLVDANAALALTNDKVFHSNDALALANQELTSSNKDLALRNSKLEQTNHGLVVENAKLTLEVGALKRGQHDATKGFEGRVKRVDERYAADRKQIYDICKDVEVVKGVLDRDRKHKLESLALFEKLFPEHGQGGSAVVGKTAIGPPFQSTSRGAVAGGKEWEKLESSGGSENSASGSSL